MSDLLLKGCTPEPLSSYLKALGVWRLVVEQKDPNAKGYWQNNGFKLRTHLSEDDLLHFFLHCYQPTPLVAPWNGSTGFYPKDKAQKKLLKAFSETSVERFKGYGETIAIAQAQVDDLQLKKQPTGEDKRRLLVRLRNTLPDEAIQWLDTSTLVKTDGASFPPLTGTGGNDGNFEFSRTFMQQLHELLDIKTGEPLPQAELLLKAALFDHTVPGLSFTGKIGQFNPIAAGGANAAPGYDAASRVNPWEFVLMLEGTLLFIASATRRYEHTKGGELAYPFTVRPSNVGYDSAAEADKSRAELWIPLWSSPVGLPAIKSLFNEGRGKVGRRTATDGVDFARALSNFGRDRGITEFVRYSFQERNGLSYFAVPLGRFQPRTNPQTDWLSEIDGWLLRLKREVQKENTPASLKRSHRRLETAIMRLTQEKATLLEVLIALGAVEAALDLSLRSQEQKFPSPIRTMSWSWVDQCNDESPEFRLALALAGQGLRERLVRVRYTPKGQPTWQDNDDGKTTWQHGSLTNNLIGLLKRQEIEQWQQQKQAPKDEREGKKSNPLPSALLDDVALWIAGVLDDDRIEAIARGLSLIRLDGYQARNTSSHNESSHNEKPRPVPAAYALVKLVHYRELTKSNLSKAAAKIFVRQDQSPVDIHLPDQPIPHVPGLLTRLSSGDCVQATQLAVRRLRASGYNPAIAEGIYEPRDRTLRLAAALAFPLDTWDIARLLKQVCKLDSQALQENRETDD
jgi:CRISPR-associated protein Csx17